MSGSLPPWGQVGQTLSFSPVTSGSLELARKAQTLFDRQEPREKCGLLDFLLSNCTWETVKWPPPSDNPSICWLKLS